MFNSALTDPGQRDVKWKDVSFLDERSGILIASQEMFLFLAVAPQVWVFYVISAHITHKCLVWNALVFELGFWHNKNNKYQAKPKKKISILIWSPEAFSRPLPTWVPKSTRLDSKLIDLSKYLQKENINLKGHSALAAKKKYGHWR